MILWILFRFPKLAIAAEGDLGYFLLAETFGDAAHLLFHLEQFLVGHLASSLEQWKAIDVHVVGSSLMIDLPS